MDNRACAHDAGRAPAMKVRSPSGSEIIGHEIHRKVAQSEIPSHLSLKAHEVRGVLGADGYKYIIPPGIDPLELGVIVNAGQFDMVPVDRENKPLWNESINLLVTEDQAAQQRTIVMYLYHALLDYLPHDASDLEAGVQAEAQHGGTHPIFGLLRRAAIETWAEHRGEAAVLGDDERERLYAGVARRTAALLREMAPPCKLDRKSLRAILKRPVACLWDRIAAAIAEGNYDDATLRALARVKLNRGLELPVECVVTVLPGVRQLDIFFALICHATGDVVNGLADRLWRGAAGTGFLEAEQAVRALYAIWRLASPDAACAIVRSSLRYTAHEPVSKIGGGLRVWLAEQAGDEPTLGMLANAPVSRDDVWAAVAVAERAFATTLDEILAALPEHA